MKKDASASITRAGNKAKASSVKECISNFDKLTIETGNQANLDMGVTVVYLYRHVMFQMINKVTMLSQLSVIFAQNPLTFLG
jgi:hypothetical protein